MIYLMRHGLTDWNVKKKIQGRTDVELNETGRQMAQDARKRYGDLHFDICFCSPLVRARETAEIFLKDSGTPIIPDERLMEMSFGICEGEEHAFSNPESLLYPLFQDPVNYRKVEGGESFEDLFARTGDFLEEAAYPAEREGKTVLIVAHGAAITSMICRVRNIPLEHYWDVLCANCELVLLQASV
ncbi:MAG: histidine phosphatase family protein [Lachnospiraceae bacterium]|nr:histidine phosphatase family protein [Lachnospiraceae bacterium]